MFEAGDGRWEVQTAECGEAGYSSRNKKNSVGRAMLRCKESNLGACRVKMKTGTNAASENNRESGLLTILLTIDS